MTESFAGNGLEHLINDAANGKLVTEMAAARGVWASFSTYPEGVFICFQPLPKR